MTSLTLSGSSSLKPDGGARPPAPLSAFELRLDLHPGAALPPAGDLPTIYTCRRPQDGGRFAGSEVERAAALRRALAACRPDDRIDIEWDSDFRDWPHRHPDIGFIVSYHNLSVTPPDLDGLLTRMAAEPAREYKELARNKLGDGCMASPAISGKSLILRTRKALYCIEDAAK